MFTVDEALRAVLDAARPLPARQLPLDQALGCVLTEAISADRDLPPFDKALMDGYAVRSSDLADGDRSLAIGEEILAGQWPTRPLRPREAAAIMTGAPLPEGADAVIMIEHTQRRGDQVLIDEPHVVPGLARLSRGREMKAGEVILEPGETLNSVKLGLLASVGQTKVWVRPRPTVAVVPTGDELVEPDQVPVGAQIRNSNAVMLRMAVQDAGGISQTLPIARDEPGPLQEIVQRGLDSDILVITGGVSAGRRDLVPETLERLAVRAIFHKIRLKPGKPLWFGIGPPRREGPGTLVFGLPGNPVSGIVGFLLFVKPALDALSGKPTAGPVLSRARLARAFDQSGDRPTYHPSRCVSMGTAEEFAIEPLDWAGSADLRTAARADGFAVFPAGNHHYPAGEWVDFLPLG
jgi:molybdopterin molybdotransferase